MRHSSRLAAVVSAVALLAACADSTAPDGQPTTLTARAYVDADGSGAFSPGDVPIAGATVVLTGSDGAEAGRATTDADGSATFELRPGSYTAALTGSVPAGAVLATATAPVVTAGAEGGAQAAEFRFVFRPGTVQGSVFRDDNGSGAYEPGADIPAAGIRVRLARGAATGAVVDSTRTDADGFFSFALVRPGDYTLLFEAIPGVSYTGGEAQPVTVAPAGVQELAVRFTGNLTLTVAQAKSRGDGAAVRVVGVVTAPQGSLRSDNAYLQDATGGIQVFGVPAGTALAVGDSVAVDGELDIFAGEAEIVRPRIERLGTGTVPAARKLTGAEVLARTFEGSLVHLDSVTVLAVPASGTNYNLSVRAKDGSEFQLRVEGAGAPLVPLSYWTVGQEYDVTGVLGSRNGVPQLKPRGQGDVSLAGQPTIAQARTFAAGTEVVVGGTVTVPQGAFRSDNAYIQDATGGVLVFGLPADAGLVEGDRVQVRGTIAVFSGEVEITSPTVLKLGTAPVPAPQPVTGAQIAARTYEGQLVLAGGLVVASVGGGTSASFNVTFTAPDGTPVTARIEGATGITRAAFAVGSTYDVTGVLSVFSNASGTTPQLKPRSPADVVAR